jgi:transposase-like protein
MANASQDRRKSWDDKTKLAKAEEILSAKDRREAYERIKRELEIQPYQLYAWIGQYMVDKVDNSAPAGGNLSTPIAMTRFTSGGMQLSEDEKKEIALWIFREYIMKGSA